MSRCMYHVLVIQLHHPLLVRGHDIPTPPADGVDSLALCTAAATEIVSLLVAYNRTFSIRKAPYLIAYATYVSATIHVRVAARQFPTVDSSPCLQTCLDFLNQNRETNPGVDNARASLMGLMNRMGVVCQEDQVPSGTRRGSSHPLLSPYTNTEQATNLTLIQSSSPRSDSMSVDSRMTNNPISPDLDIDSMLQSFADGQLSTSPLSTSLSIPSGPTPRHVAALVGERDVQPTNAYESLLFDPVGMDYSQAGVGGGGGYSNYTGLAGYGGPVQYDGATGTFGALDNIFLN